MQKQIEIASQLLVFRIKLYTFLKVTLNNARAKENYGVLRNRILVTSSTTGSLVSLQ